MIRRIAFAVALAALMAACAPARPGPLGPQAPAEGDRLAWAAFHLRDARGAGPLEALKALDAPAAAGEDPAREPLLRALAFRQLGRNAEAVAVLDRLLASPAALPPQARAEAFVERGLALGNMGRQARAAEDFDAALRLAPGYVPALMARADQHFALERFAEAEAGYGRIIEADPGNVLAYVNRGVARDELGRLDGAIADFTLALERDPASVAALTNRGVTRSQTGDFKGMCADYGAACRLGACARLSSARAQGYCAEGR